MDLGAIEFFFVFVEGAFSGTLSGVVLCELSGVDEERFEDDSELVGVDFADEVDSSGEDSTASSVVWAFLSRSSVAVESGLPAV